MSKHSPKTTPDYNDPRKREKTLDGILWNPTENSHIPEVTWYSSRCIILAREEVRKKVEGLIRHCPHGDDLLNHLTLRLNKPKKPKPKKLLAA